VRTADLSIFAQSRPGTARGMFSKNAAGDVGDAGNAALCEHGEHRFDVDAVGSRSALTERPAG
jgi:hypothetical protein